MDSDGTIQPVRSVYSSKRRRWPKRTLIGLGTIVLLFALLGFGGWLYLNYRFGQIKKVTLPGIVSAGAGKPFNMLLVGSDTRAFVSNAKQAGAFGSAAEQTGERSDVTMIVRFVPATHKVLILSIPRDTWVDIPGGVSGISGQNRINAAFNDGPELLVRTVEQDFHIPINHYAEVDFPGFEGMVNALGGLYLDFPMPVRDAESGLSITTTGCQLVKGTQALALVRSRHLYYEQGGQWHYDVQSDFSRIRRQDAFFRGMLARISANITNPLALNDFLGATVKNVTIDSSLSKGTLVDLAREFHGLAGSDLVTETLPTTEGYAGAAAVLFPAQPYAKAMISQFLAFGDGATPESGSAVGSPAPAEPARLTALRRGGSGPDPTTTVPPNVVTNTEPEPWNPTPCSP